MDKILVTGGLGNIGSHTAKALVDLGQQVVVTSRRNAEVPSFLAGRVEVEALDVGDRDAFVGLAKRHEFGGIVHLAAAGLEITDRLEFLRINTTGLLNALDAARTWGVRRFAVASSIGVYAGLPETTYREDLSLPSTPETHPIPFFKKAAEIMTTSALTETGIHPILLRIGSIWGPLGMPDSPFLPFPAVIDAVAKGKEPPSLYADDGGDRCYAPDAGRAIALLMTTENLRHTTYNISSGIPATNRDFADSIAKASPGTEIDLLPGRVGNNPGPDPYLDITRLTADTGFTPSYDLDTAVADYLTWLTTHPR